MKSLNKYISRVKDLHSLNEYLTEKLVVSKNYKDNNDDFYLNEISKLIYVNYNHENTRVYNGTSYGVIVTGMIYTMLVKHFSHVVDDNDMPAFKKHVQKKYLDLGYTEMFEAKEYKRAMITKDTEDIPKALNNKVCDNINTFDFDVIKLNEDWDQAIVVYENENYLLIALGTMNSNKKIIKEIDGIILVEK